MNPSKFFFLKELGVLRFLSQFKDVDFLSVHNCMYNMYEYSVVTFRRR